MAPSAPSGQPVRKTYHHGNLRAALLHSARDLLEKKGITALGLRAITRHAGVSAAAAIPHFGNLAGLLSVLATIGYEELAHALAPTLGQGTQQAAGMAYIRFAMDNPGLFTLMFRSDAIDRTEPGLVHASARTSAMLTQLIGSLPGPHAARTRAGTRAALWGRVHGLAVLAIDGQLDALPSLEGQSMSLEALVEDALR
ncbi:TetR/AcrR family transcriptional regulator [Komagataeibacter sp. FNDCF1]|nr:TetR/AcrR family transcriptional regulator [Komagataeibacter sp. FNDCF1]MCE2563690.1 TetR/AcrR family transcriptional regulator [Komagataeibacter sp. FNDCF1]